MAFTPESLPDLSGKVYLVTGGNTGIGLKTVVELAAHNAKVYMGARSEARANAAIEEIRSAYPQADISPLLMDMMNLKSVKMAAENFSRQELRLHGLINNAGIMGTPFEESEDGYEAQFQTNYLSHWLLTYLLLPIITETARLSKPGTVRIANVSSDGHLIFAPSNGIDFEDINQINGGVWSRYGMSKLANILHAKELHRRYGPSKPSPTQGEIWTASLHPGTIGTNLGVKATGTLWFQMIHKATGLLGLYSPIETAAYTSLYVIAASEFPRNKSGEYFKPVGLVGQASRSANDINLAVKLWDWSECEMKRIDMIDSRDVA